MLVLSKSLNKGRGENSNGRMQLISVYRRNYKRKITIKWPVKTDL